MSRYFVAEMRAVSLGQSRVNLSTRPPNQPPTAPPPSGPPPPAPPPKSANSPAHQFASPQIAGGPVFPTTQTPARRDPEGQVRPFPAVATTGGPVPTAHPDGSPVPPGTPPGPPPDPGPHSPWWAS